LTDQPTQAGWLNAEERAGLAGEMEKERRLVETGRSISVLQFLFNPRVLALAAIHFGQAGVSVGMAVFADQIIKQLGLTNHCEEPPGRRYAPPEDRLHDEAILI
jgi:ACS family tartrate transporter-like MFS transporter